MFLGGFAAGIRASRISIVLAAASGGEKVMK